MSRDKAVTRERWDYRITDHEATGPPDHKTTGLRDHGPEVGGPAGVFGGSHSLAAHARTVIFQVRRAVRN